jgi:phosphohistidine phosphatase
MERWLLILRHGKSERGPEYDTDFERPLAARGKQAAKTTGAWLAKHEPAVQLIASSSAERAIQTARLVQQELPAVPIIEDEELYAAGLNRLLGVVTKLPDANTCVLLVGHNPGLEELASHLTGDSGILLKTCSLARVMLAGDTWVEALQAKGVLAGVQHPRDLED